MAPNVGRVFLESGRTESRSFDGKFAAPYVSTANMTANIADADGQQQTYVDSVGRISI